VNSAGPGLAFLLLISVPLCWAYMRPRRWRGRFTVGDLVIFPTSTFLQVGGIFVAFVIGSMLIFAFLAQKRAEPQVLLMMILLFFVGLSVLFRQVELDPEGITVRYTWFKQRMRWSEIQSAHRLGNGSWLLLGGFRRMKLDRHYSDFELLVLGIARQLESRQNAAQRPSYEDSCRHLQSVGLLPEGIMPVFPDRLPQFDDPQNYGIRFFRTHLDHTSDLSVWLEALLGARRFEEPSLSTRISARAILLGITSRMLISAMRSSRDQTCDHLSMWRYVSCARTSVALT
jgi:hypothetical protein